MKASTRSIAIAVLMVFIVSCCDDDNNFPNNGRGVYITGFSGGKVVYWKDDVKTILPSTPNEGFGNAIYVDSLDVYVGGQDDSLPVYWKNNIKFILPSLGNGTVSGITKFNGDLYCVGSSNPTGTYDGKAVYWKNGTMFLLPDSSDGSSSATSIFTSGNDIYIAGQDSLKAVYWKNGNLVTLPTDLGINSYGFSIFVNDIDVYVAGYHGDYACYWKNDLRTFLMPFEHSIANGICFNENDVVVCGRVNYSPMIWINGTMTSPELPSGYTDGNARSMYYNGDIYIAGQEESPTYQLNAIYWKNGVRHFIESDAGARAIFVR